MKLINYTIEIIKAIFINLCAGIITTLFITKNENGIIPNILLSIFLAVFLISIYYTAKQKINELQEEDRIIKMIKNIWDESLREDPITTQIDKSAHYQNRLDDILIMNMQTKFRKISWEKLQYIAKHNSLDGIDIGRNNFI